MTRCVVNATNAPACSQSFTAMFNLFWLQGDNCQKSLDQQKLENGKLPRLNLNLTYVIIRCIHISNLTLNGCNHCRDNEWKLTIWFFFPKFKRDNCQKSTDHNQIQTWPAYCNDESTHAIPILYVHINKS